MNIEVRYLSRGGNTKKIAEAIAEAAGTKACDCDETVITAPVDLLFLGTALYGFGLDENMVAFINGLDASLVKAVAVFSTSAIMDSVNRKMAGLMKKKGIRVLDERFYCRGEFIKMHTGRPNESDLVNAAQFAKRVLESL